MEVWLMLEHTYVFKSISSSRKPAQAFSKLSGSIVQRKERNLITVL